MIRQRQSRRSGTAATEAVFCIPIVLLITFGTLDVCNTIFLKETVTVAAYEGARVGTKRLATRADAEAMVRTILTARGVVEKRANDFEIIVSPSNFSSLKALDPITVWVNVPVNGYVPFVRDVMGLRRVGATLRMVREFDQ
jgi:Flp pilus assembly protein TadG